MPEKIQILSKSGLFIDCDIYKADGQFQPVVIFAHGFKGFKNWGGFPYMMSKIAESGLNAVSFNFTHNGVSSHAPEEFTRLDLFAENTHSKELDDLESVTDYFWQHADNFAMDKEKIALVGHSRGGAAVLIRTAEDQRIKTTVTLASVATVNRYTDEQKNRWKKNGYIEIPNARTGQLMRMNKTFLDDIEMNSERLNILNAASKINVPLLVIHGKEDLAVKYTDAEKIYVASGKTQTELFIIENTGHTFGVEHPFKGSTIAFDSAIDKTIDFIKKGLS